MARFCHILGCPCALAMEGGAMLTNPVFARALGQSSAQGLPEVGRGLRQGSGGGRQAPPTWTIISAPRMFFSLNRVVAAAVLAAKEAHGTIWALWEREFATGMLVSWVTFAGIAMERPGTTWSRKGGVESFQPGGAPQAEASSGATGHFLSLRGADATLWWVEILKN